MNTISNIQERGNNLADFNENNLALAHNGGEWQRGDVTADLSIHEEEVSAPSFVNPLVDAVGPDLTIPGQEEENQSMKSYQGQQQRNHPALFDQNQFENDFGPVYAVPSFPPHYDLGAGNMPEHHNHGHDMRGGQWHQCCNHPYAVIPYYMYPTIGHQYYQ